MTQPDDNYAWKVTTVPALSRRDWFAGMALAAIIANPDGNSLSKLTGWAVEYADALIAALDKETK